MFLNRPPWRWRDSGNLMQGMGIGYLLVLWGVHPDWISATGLLVVGLLVETCLGRRSAS